MTQQPSQKLPPLTSLPEPPRKPTRAYEVDYPEEILLDSVKELHRVAGWPIYAWFVPLGAVSWGLLALSFIMSLSPLLWLLLLLALVDPAILDAVLRQLGMPLAGVLSILVGGPLIGAILGAVAVPVGLWGVAKIRPRHYLSEAAFRSAIAHRLALAMAAPQVLFVAILAMLSLIPGAFIWGQFSFSVLAMLAGMTSIIIVTYLVAHACASKANVLRLPSTTELTMRAQSAMNPAERTRLWGILYAQDRRHLPRNITIVGPRFFVTAAAILAKYHWWVVLTLALLFGPLWWGVDSIQAFRGVEAVSSYGPSTYDPQAEVDVSFIELGFAFVAIAGWFIAAAALPLFAIFVVPVRGREPRDLRTYPDVSDRLAVNPWEKAVIVVGTIVFPLIELLIIIGCCVMMVLLGQWSEVDVLWAGLLVCVGIPLSAVATWRALARGLRTIVYGPAHWYARRATPTAAITPVRGTKASLEGDPRIAERKAKERAAKLGLHENATPEQLAKAAAQAGQLPDLGLEDDPYEPWSPGEPERTSEHSIPKGLDDLRR